MSDLQTAIDRLESFNYFYRKNGGQIGIDYVDDVDALLAAWNTRPAQKALDGLSVDVDRLKTELAGQAMYDLVKNGNEEMFDIVYLITNRCIDYLNELGHLSPYLRAPNEDALAALDASINEIANSDNPSRAANNAKYFIEKYGIEIRKALGGD